MRVLIQRVRKASITIDNTEYSKISDGLLVLVGIENDDEEEDINYLCRKILNLRIFDDEQGIMNKSVVEIKGEVMIVSQFTLHANTKKGNRPSYINAAKQDVAIPIYENLIDRLKKLSGITIKTGKFGADMDIALINNGPVTIWIDSKNK